MANINFSEIKFSHFFDRELVYDKLKAAEVKGLSRIGAFDRRTMKGLIRKPGKKGKPAKPGKPPKNRTGLLKEFIYFALDTTDRSNYAVVTGPKLLNSKQQYNVPTPELLDQGGTVQRRVREERQERVRDAMGRYVKASKYVYPRRPVKYAPHPFVEPTYEKNKDKRVKIWKGTFK